MAILYHHARELRTIGQQLDKQNIDIYDLRYDKGDYTLVCADPNPPFIDLIQLRYSAFDLTSLESRAVSARSAGFKTVEFASQGEILRAVGRYVEKLDSKLARISAPDTVTEGSMFKIEYEGRDGRVRTQELFAKEITELVVRMYKERSCISGTAGKGGSAT